MLTIQMYQAGYAQRGDYTLLLSALLLRGTFGTFVLKFIKALCSPSATISVLLVPYLT
jgi:hypothetical protein